MGSAHEVALDDSADTAELFGLIWGTTLGLARAHYFAFRVSSRLVRGSSFHRRELDLAFAQLGGAVGVAVALVKNKLIGH